MHPVMAAVHILVISLWLVTMVTTSQEVLVTTQHGAVRGLREKTHQVFRGIRYAQAPVGDLR